VNKLSLRQLLRIASALDMEVCACVGLRLARSSLVATMARLDSDPTQSTVELLDMIIRSAAKAIDENS
jgi:hypothetical protein